MKKFESVIEKGKIYIDQNQHDDWMRDCRVIYNNSGLNEVGVEVIYDSVEMMRLLNETDMKVKDILYKVLSSSDNGVLFSLSVLLVGRFSKEREFFISEFKKIRKFSKQSIAFDDFVSDKVKRL